MKPFVVVVVLLLVCPLYTKPPSWKTLLSSTRERGSICNIYTHFEGFTDSTEHKQDAGLWVGFSSGDIVSYSLTRDRVKYINSHFESKLPANLTSFGYLPDLNIFYAGLNDSSIWQLVPAHGQSEGEATWTETYKNQSVGAINQLLPFMKGGFFDLYFTGTNGLIAEYNTFYNFGNNIYSGYFGVAQPTVSVYVDFQNLTDPAAAYRKCLISAFSNGGLTVTYVGQAGNPETQILQPLGPAISKLVPYRAPAEPFLIVGTGLPLNQVIIYGLTSGRELYRSNELPASIGDLIITSDLSTKIDSIVVGLTDGSVYQLPLSNITTFRAVQLASPELFGGFPVTSLQYNWIIQVDEVAQTTTRVPVLLAASKYGTISALFTNDSDWKFVASPVSWERPQHIQHLVVTPHSYNASRIPKKRNVLVAILDEGEVAYLSSSNWNFVVSSPSLEQTRSETRIHTENLISLTIPHFHPALFFMDKNYHYFDQRIPQFAPNANITAIVQEHGFKSQSLGPISFSMLQALTYNDVAVAIVLTCPDTSDTLNVAVLGFQINSQPWRFDGQAVLIVDPITSQQRSITYEGLLLYSANGCQYQWTETVAPL